MPNKFNKIKDFITNLIFPNNIKCIFCDEELNQNEINKVCENCYPTLPFISNPCQKCGSQMNANQFGVCLRCKRNNYYFANAKSVFIYEKELVKTIHGIKYNNKKYLIEHLTKFLLEKYATSEIVVDLVTCIPMFNKKVKKRGYNQSLEFAKLFAEKASIRFYETCDKIKETPSQTTLNIQQRTENIKDCFKLKQEIKSIIKNKNILIIDDVFTTGATTNELSKILLNSGAKNCYVLTLASTKLEQISIEQDS